MRLGWLAAALCGVLASCQWGAYQVGAPSPAVVAADSAIREALARERSIDASDFPPRTVAVAPFEVIASDTSLSVLGFGLADFLMTDLARSGELLVVDRLRLDALTRELRLTSLGIVDTSRAAQVGRLLGARRMVVGSLSVPANTRARLDGRIGDVATGVIEATEGTETSLDAVLDAEKELAFAVFERLGVALSPAERARVEQRPTRSLAALLAYSRGIRAEAYLDYSQARQSYQAALRIDPTFEAADSRLDEVPTTPEVQLPALAASPVSRAAESATNAVNVPVLSPIATAADPAFRQRLVTTIIIIINIP